MQLEDYISGTVSIANGSTALTGTGTAWKTAALKAGDIFYKAGYAILIASVDDEDAITLADAWPGTTLADAGYAIRFAPDNSRVQGTTRQLLDTLRDGFSLVGKSTTSLAIGTGSKTFDVGVSNLGWGVGARLRASSDADAANFMEGIVTAYSDASLTLDVDLIGGSGTKADWTINLAGEPGGDADIAADTHAATGKTTPVDADELPLADSAATFGLKKLTWANVKATLKTYLDTLYLSTTLARREVLTANRSYYVRTTGSDSNDGLTSGNAFLTVQQAVNVALGLDMSIYAVTIDIGAGTFSEGTFLAIAGNGNARITLQGAGYSSTTISGSTYGIQPTGGLSLTIKDLTITGSSVGLWVRYGAQVSLRGSVAFGGGSARLMGADNGGYIEGIGTGTNIYLGANSAYAFYAIALGHIILGSSGTILTTAARTFTATAYAAYGGVLEIGGATFDVSAGAVTGSRYSAALNGIINTNGGGASYIPGSTTGSTATGGQYV